MKALITGASSGIGKDMACILSRMGVEVFLVARRGQRLLELQTELPSKSTVIVLDISSKKNCVALYKRMEKENIDLLINNAGFGDYGEFDKTQLTKEIQMINTNVIALHILTKLFLKDFKKRNHGRILNVASSAAFLPGPLMATYYASKSYVLRLSMGIAKELKKSKSKVSISVLCPGPVQTEFDQVANVSFLMKGKTSEEVAAYAIEGTMKNKLIIIPGMLMKAGYFCTKVFPNQVLMECSYHIQHKKNKQKT